MKKDISPWEKRIKMEIGNWITQLNCPVFFSFLSDFFVFIVVIFSIEMSSIELVVLLVY